jgi:signal transduction histidine kinase
MALNSSLTSQTAPIIERAPLPLVEVQGKAHIITYVNPAFCRLLGKTSGDLVGTAFADIVPGGDKCVPILDTVYETGEGRVHTLEDRSDLNPACWLYAMWPALDAAGVPVGVVIQMTKDALFRQNVAAVNEALLVAGLGQHELRERAEKLNVQLQAEIVERQQAQAGLQEAKAQLANHASELERMVARRTSKLRETVADLEAFSYSVAHDLRAPLRSMQGYSTSLLEEYAEKLDQTAKMYLERMARSAARMDKLIQDVLSYS